MKDEDKSKSQLIAELQEMRKRVADLTHPLKDIERGQTEVSLHLAKVIFDKAPIGIWITGKDGEVLDVNEQGRDSLGYTKEELRRMTIFDFNVGYTLKDWVTGTAILNRGDIRIFETLHQRRNGELFPVEVIQNLVRFEGQEFRVGFVQDITERKRAEEQLRQSRKNLEEAQRIANMGHWEINLANNKMYWSDQLLKLHGLSPDDVMPTPEDALKLVHPDDREMVEYEYSKLTPDNPECELEHQLILPSCRIQYLIARASLKSDENKNPLSVIGTVIDISERKESETALKNA